MFTIGSAFVIVFAGLPRVAQKELGKTIVLAKDQDRMQFCITFCMALGRAAGPPMATYVSPDVWPTCMMGICLAVGLITVVVWRHLVPFEEHPRNKKVIALLKKGGFEFKPIQVV